jgi:Zn-dependent protease with chaperone function
VLIKGIYLDGITSKGVSARLELVSRQQKSLAIISEDDNKQLLVFQLSNLDISSRIGDAPREINVDSGEQFITNDNDGIDQLLRQLIPDGIAPSVLHTLERNLTAIALSIITSIAFVWLITVYGIPRAAEYIAFNMPNVVVEQFEMDMAILDSTIFEPSELTTDRKNDIKRVMDPFIKQYISLPETHLKPSLDFRSGMGANAFALPSGKIIFTDALVNLVEHDNELVAVFFHELGHLRQKHMMRRSIQDAIVTISVFFIIGDLDALEIAGAIPALLADMSYSRDFEREADLYALQQMNGQGIDLDYFRNVMKRLSEEFADHDKDVSERSDDVGDQIMVKVPEFLVTHPGWRERILFVDEFESTSRLDGEIN